MCKIEKTLGDLRENKESDVLVLEAATTDIF